MLRVDLVDLIIIIVLFIAAPVIPYLMILFFLPSYEDICKEAGIDIDERKRPQ